MWNRCEIVVCRTIHLVYIRIKSIFDFLVHRNKTEKDWSYSWITSIRFELNDSTSFFKDRSLEIQTLIAIENPLKKRHRLKIERINASRCRCMHHPELLQDLKQWNLVMHQSILLDACSSTSRPTAGGLAHSCSEASVPSIARPPILTSSAEAHTHSLLIHSSIHPLVLSIH